MTEISSLHVTSETDPVLALSLPEGRLKIGEYTVTFSPDQVLAAANKIVVHFGHEEVYDEEPVFVSQAGVIAYALEQLEVRTLEATAY